MIESAQWIVDCGPGAGMEGGEIIFQGSMDDFKLKGGGLTAEYLRGERMISEKLIPGEALAGGADDYLILSGASLHNLKKPVVRLPLKRLIGVAGVSGSGKSTLISDVLVPLLQERFARGQDSEEDADIFHENDPGARLSGGSGLTAVRCITQAPIGRVRSSTPATYIGVWDKIRTFYSKLPEAKDKSMGASWFSYNSGPGVCPSCGGQGVRELTIALNSSIETPCEECGGSRFREEVLSVRYRDRSIADCLALTVTEALKLFADEKGIAPLLSLLEETGMGYVTLGQPAPTLSGGEGQRIKLAREIGRNTRGPALYVLDEPTSGLHFHDTAQLYRLLRRLVGSGHSVLLVEHNTELLSLCDYLIELGPEGGPGGGQLIAEGTPVDLRKNPLSITGPYF